MPEEPYELDPNSDRVLSPEYAGVDSAEVAPRWHRLRWAIGKILDGFGQADIDGKSRFLG